MSHRNDNEIVVVCTTLPNPELPPNTTKLYCCGNTALKYLPPLPEGLTVLCCCGCTNLEWVESLPSTLKSVDFSGCTSLRTLPLLPDGLEDVKCTDCKFDSIYSPSDTRAFLITKGDPLSHISIVYEDGSYVNFHRYHNAWYTGRSRKSVSISYIQQCVDEAGVVYSRGRDRKQLSKIGVKINGLVYFKEHFLQVTGADRSRRWSRYAMADYLGLKGYNGDWQNHRPQDTADMLWTIQRCLEERY